MEKSSKTEFVTLRSYTKHRGGTRGDHGTRHRYLTDGVLIESENTWFKHELYFRCRCRARDPSRRRRETREKEEKEFEESENRDEEVKFW